jgi:hypothetical protein
MSDNGVAMLLIVMGNFKNTRAVQIKLYEK